MDIGAKRICNTCDTNFMENLVSALVTTDATLGFDATDGGNGVELASQILSAMEVAANKRG